MSPLALFTSYSETVGTESLQFLRLFPLAGTVHAEMHTEWIPPEDQGTEQASEFVASSTVATSECLLILSISNEPPNEFHEANSALASCHFLDIEEYEAE